jgi:hypothetical protein
MRTRGLAFIFFLTVSAAIAQDFSGTVSENLEDPNANPITGGGRIMWTISNTIGLNNLLGDLFSAGVGTAFNQPREYGTHWDGFGKRYGLALAGSATSNTMEAELGAIWGEDPRYHRAEDGSSFGARVRHAVKLTFLAQNRDGEIVPAYARYAGIVGSNFLSNAWRPDSEANTPHAITRIELGFVGRMTSNLFEEFWPDLRDRLFHHGR